MIQLYHGDGKGKTTAAVGAAVRAAGRGRGVIVAQFLKGGESGEINVLSKLPKIRVLRSEKAFPFFDRMTEEEKRELTEIHNDILRRIRTAIWDNGADFIVLDEITHACNFQLLDEKLLKKILDFGKGERIEIVLTGRKPPKELLGVSDYISEIRCIRHPYKNGVGARVGIEL